VRNEWGKSLNEHFGNLPCDLLDFLVSISAGFSQSLMVPITDFTSGWLIIVVNHRVTFPKGFLQVQKIKKLKKKNQELIALKRKSLINRST